ncbi:glycosyltransferase [Pedobacter frigidisoli]|uniref:glycosyltransferase n=1 Tax=Pedobacter frigidisoli TaxID=2530455 RepID=UPI001CECFF4A|nr:glycosyltransferase [Pedobacter frigidisoli]
MENQDIIIVGQQGWDTEIGSNCKNIALEFSKKNRVIYVNPPLDRISKWRGKNEQRIQKRLAVISGATNGFVMVEKNLYVLDPDCLIESINWLPVGKVYNYLNKINNERFFASIKKAVDQIHFKSDMLFNDSDMLRSFHLKKLLNPKISVYYSRDNMLATSYYKKHGSVMEPKIIAQSDLCFTNSGYLENYCKKYNINAYNVGQGCDFSLFDEPANYSVEKELEHIQKPRIGYIGVLTSARLDIDIIEHIALAKPDWNIVLVGPEDDLFKKSVLHTLPNVHFLGAKPVDALPNYIDAFDVCFNPQLLNDLTIGNYPRKIDEYLALGKPTIATKTEAMEAFKDHVFLADGKDDYVSGIASLLSEDSKVLNDNRRTFARSHTWTNSVDLMYQLIKKFKKSL